MEKVYFSVKQHSTVSTFSGELLFQKSYLSIVATFSEEPFFHNMLLQGRYFFTAPFLLLSLIPVTCWSVGALSCVSIIPRKVASWTYIIQLVGCNKFCGTATFCVIYSFNAFFNGSYVFVAVILFLQKILFQKVKYFRKAIF